MDRGASSPAEPTPHDRSPAATLLRFGFDSCDSTNTRAAELARAHPGAVLLVTARTQTAGRGRGGRAWASPIGGAWFTLAVPAPGPPARYEPAPLLAGLAVAQALEQLCAAHPACGARRSSCDLQLKWPNDVLLGGRKMAGVLCERELPAAGGDSGAGPPTAVLLLGIGINADFDAGQLPPDLRFPATTLRDVLGHAVDVPALIDAVALRLLEHLAPLARHGLTPALLAAIRARLAWRGREVTVALPGRTLRGVCRGVDERGALLVETREGVQALTSGEILPPQA